MKQLIIGMLILALAITLAGCDSTPAILGEEEEEPVGEQEEEEEPTPDAEQIEAVLQEYYDAFYCYDVDRVGKTIAKESLEEEGAEILLSVAWAESINFQGELKSITSIQIDGNTALAVVECETSLGLGEDTWHLVREDGSWKIASRAKTSEPTIEEPEPIEPDVEEPEPVQELEPVGKQFGGIISRNAVLNPENSPFLLTSHVLVPNGVNLIINPGVIIDFNDKFIQVDGTLQARGKPDSPIQFLSSVGSNEGNRILFTEKSTPWNDEEESGCIVEYANLRVHNTGYGVYAPIEIRGASPRIANNSVLNLGDLGSAILVWEGSPVIKGNILEADQIGIQIEHSEARVIGNVIKGAARGLIIRGEFRCQVKQNLIRDNGTGIQWWYLSYHGSFSSVRGTLTQNTIVSNSYHGIRIENISDPNITLPTIHSNSIHDNGEYNIYLESTSVDLDLTNNWWGTTALNIIKEGFYHQLQDFRLGRILFEPFLAGPVNEAPKP